MYYKIIDRFGMENRYILSKDGRMFSRYIETTDKFGNKHFTFEGEAKRPPNGAVRVSI